MTESYVNSRSVKCEDDAHHSEVYSQSSFILSWWKIWSSVIWPRGNMIHRLRSLPWRAVLRHVSQWSLPSCSFDWSAVRLHSMMKRRRKKFHGSLQLCLTFNDKLEQVEMNKFTSIPTVRSSSPFPAPDWHMLCTLLFWNMSPAPMCYVQSTSAKSHIPGYSRLASCSRFLDFVIIFRSSVVVGRWKYEAQDFPEPILKLGNK